RVSICISNPCTKTLSLHNALPIFVLSDGSTAHFQPVEKSLLEQKMRGQTLEAQIYQGVTRLPRDNREAIQERYPKILRRVSGYKDRKSTRLNSSHLSNSYAVFCFK